MSNEHRKRMESIYQMLFEIAAGNFSFKIENSGDDDELDELIALVNMVAEELRNTVFHHGYINSHFAYQYLVQDTFILDQQFHVKSFTPEVMGNMGFNSTDLLNRPFIQLLSQQSCEIWDTLCHQIISDPYFHCTAPLIFISGKGLLIPSFCMISRLLHSTKIVISTVTIVVNDSLYPNPILLNARVNEDVPPEKHHDAELIQRLYDFIVENLDSPLPTVRELSLKFGTNEHKLKDGFRHFFKTSIYQFYNNERLKRAHLLIQQTNLPLKVISDMAGFNLYTNFSKSFKKRFGYSPNSVQRNPK